MQERFSATLLLDSDYDTVVDRDTIVLKEDGTPLLIYRTGVIPAAYCRAAFENLKLAAQEADSTNRGMASGRGKIEGADIGEVSGTRIRIRKQDGTLSQTNRSLLNDETQRLVKRQGGKVLMQRSDGSFEERQNGDAPSGVVGYVDRNPRFPYCRLTAFNINHPEMFAASLPLIRSVDRTFERELPDRYAAQRAVVERTSPDFYISGTVFTTLTVNLNFQTAVHKDAGDLKEGFGVMAALRAGKYEGCYTVFPQYRIAANMQTGDVLLADVHEWHGNSPLHPKGAYERLSLVFYYREGVKNCGTATAELEKAQMTKGITHLEGWRR
jgi:hypothetical protein